MIVMVENKEVWEQFQNPDIIFTCVFFICMTNNSNYSLIN